ncbi:hypothetical protein DGI_2069 [Megalodesulfovibrio gigas DSM 1382 = ATCC 19364]|uniref:Uncharacterized protein n=1 Tax=Megalodesulfovibrio gigas (strain ATCC 19364 / DSM 1382 / NCIMB 9332 / VKM B-1759) TaxID=1121448 RepID=T2GD43_MEGG1|nr:hypothetical protein DGI_2069 [Megalodesulfovibrio gigas DSM 1382 = ATCC 19364]
MCKCLIAAAVLRSHRYTNFGQPFDETGAFNTYLLPFAKHTQLVR